MTPLFWGWKLASAIASKLFWGWDKGLVGSAYHGKLGGSAYLHGAHGRCYVSRTTGSAELRGVKGKAEI